MRRTSTTIITAQVQIAIEIESMQRLADPQAAWEQVEERLLGVLEEIRVRANPRLYRAAIRDLELIPHSMDWHDETGWDD